MLYKNPMRYKTKDEIFSFLDHKTIIQPKLIMAHLKHNLVGFEIKAADNRYWATQYQIRYEMGIDMANKLCDFYDQQKHGGQPLPNYGVWYDHLSEADKAQVIRTNIHTGERF